MSDLGEKGGGRAEGGGQRVPLDGGPHHRLQEPLRRQHHRRQVDPDGRALRRGQESPPGESLIQGGPTEFYS